MHASLAVHPGDWLRREIIDDHLNVTRQTISRLFNRRQDLTAEMALRFEKLFGIDADTLMRMQARHALAVARLHADDLRGKPLAA